MKKKSISSQNLERNDLSAYDVFEYRLDENWMNLRG